jgi:hypothetical protein
MAIIVGGVIGGLLILTILWDAFETIVLPRRVTRRVRLARLVVGNGWAAWAALVRTVRSRRRREAYLGFFGPLVVIVLLAIWAAGLIVGFGMVQWAVGSHLLTPEHRRGGVGTDLYFSGTTFFTLGLGDVAPHSGAARALTVVEAGLGFAFLAMVISYLPVLYQSFSRREARISMLDEWAGSPPCAGELVRRLGRNCALLGPFLQEWEQWSAELLETHISYPVLAYYRSQHDNQSWLAALTALLDTCALVIACVGEVPARTAELTFAMARHAVVDLCQVMNAPPRARTLDRLPAEGLARLWMLLREAGVPLRDEAAAARRLGDLRALYEPYANALAERLMLELPAWMAAAGARDNWQRTPWKQWAAVDGSWEPERIR